MRKFNLSIAVIIGLLAASTATFAQSGFAKTHPRRHEVNDRLANQNKRIHHDVKDGDMSKKQASNLHKDDHQIRQEERDMASQNHSHITKREQKTLNQQENKTSKKIGS